MTTFTTLRRPVGLMAIALLASTSACADLADTTNSLDQLVIAGPVAPSLTTDASYTVGQNIVVDFAGLSGAPSDWITLANSGDGDTSFITYQYTSGGTNGSIVFAAPGLPAGTYEARAFNDWEGTSSVTVVARTEFTVVASGNSVTTSAPSYASGAPIVVDYTGLPGTPTDWIALAVPNSPNEMFVGYAYTPGTPSGQVTLGGLAPGQYVARSFSTDSFNRVGESAVFTVTGQNVSTSQAQYSPSDTITVNFVGLPADATNWIALAPAGSAPDQYVTYTYLPAATSGSVQFAALAAGSYEARAYLHDSFTSAGTATFSVGVAAAPVVTVAQDSYTTAETVTATYTVTGNPADWVAVAIANSPSDSFVQYSYVSPSGMVSFAGLAANDYELRLYSNDTFTIIASDTFTVTTGVGPQPAAVSTAANFTPGQSITVDFSNLPGLPGDWIGISNAASNDDEYLAFIYTGGQAMGTVDFGDLGLADGSYEARAYKNDTFEVVARTTFTVGL